jgi:hypothetical protein
MGSNISLPALDVKPPQPSNPLEDFQRILAIRDLQNKQALAPGQLQEQQNVLQQQKLELQDDATWRSSFQKLGDPNSGVTDLDGVMKDALKSGVGAKSYTAMAQQLTTLKEGYAKLGKETLENLNTLNDQVGNLYQGVLDQPSGPKRVQAQQEAVQKATDIVNNATWMDPTTKQHMLSQIAQVPTDAPLDDDHLKQQIGLIVMHSELAANAEKLSTAAKNAAETPGLQAKSLQEEQQANLGPTGRAMAGNLPYQAAAGGPQSTAAGALNLETQQKVAAARAGMQGAPPAVAGVAPHLAPTVIGLKQKADEKYLAAKQTSDNIAAMVQAAQGGNKVAFSVMPLEGTLQITTSQGVHRINRTEVEAYGGGSLLDNIMAKLGKLTSGESIPPNILADMSKLQDIMKKGSQSLYSGEVNSINSNYGSKFTPDAGGSMGASATGATHRYDPNTGTVSPIGSQ